MAYDEALVSAKLRRWEKYLNNYRLPQWNDIPNMGLYMEQVLTLLKEYLDYLPPELKEEQFITAATINNYVHKKFMPEPVKKRYYRVHIAYMIMICTLKHSLSISTVQNLIPVGLSEDEVREVYTAYALRHKQTAEYFVEQVRCIAAPILRAEVSGGMEAHTTEDLITTSAVISAFSRILAEKLLLLDGRVSDGADGMKAKEQRRT